MKLGKRVARRRHHNQRNFTQRFADQRWEFKRQRRENPQIATFFQNGLVRRHQSLYEQPQWSQWKLFCKRLRCCSDFACWKKHIDDNREFRSEELLVGNEVVSKCSSRWS